MASEQLGSFADKNFSADAHVESSFSTLNEEQVRAYYSHLQASKASTEKDLRQSVFEHYAKFISTSRAIGDLETDVLDLRNLLTDVSSSIRGLLDIRLTFEQGSDVGAPSSTSGISAAGSGIMSSAAAADVAITSVSATVGAPANGAAASAVAAAAAVSASSAVSGSAGVADSGVTRLPGALSLSTADASARRAALRCVQWVLDVPDELDALVTQRKFSEAVALIEKASAAFREEPYRSGAGQIAQHIAKRSAWLRRVLAHDLSKPMLKHGDSRRLIALLIRLGYARDARDIFLRSRSAAIQHAVKKVKFDGNAVAYVAVLSRAVFALLRATLDDIHATFSHHHLTSGVVVWVQRELDAYARVFARHVFQSQQSNDSFSVVGDCLTLARDSVRSLQQHGLSFLYLIDVLFASSITRAIDTWAARVDTALRSSLADEPWCSKPAAYTGDWRSMLRRLSAPVAPAVAAAAAVAAGQTHPSASPDASGAPSATLALAAASTATTTFAAADDADRRSSRSSSDARATSPVPGMQHHLTVPGADVSQASPRALPHASSSSSPMPGASSASSLARSGSLVGAGGLASAASTRRRSGAAQAFVPRMSATAAYFTEQMVRFVSSCEHVVALPHYPVVVRACEDLFENFVHDLAQTVLAHGIDDGLLSALLNTAPATGAAAAVGMSDVQILSLLADLSWIADHLLPHVTRQVAALLRRPVPELLRLKQRLDAAHDDTPLVHIVLRAWCDWRAASLVPSDLPYTDAAAAFDSATAQPSRPWLRMFSVLVREVRPAIQQHWQAEYVRVILPMLLTAVVERLATDVPWHTARLTLAGVQQLQLDLKLLAHVNDGVFFAAAVQDGVMDLLGAVLRSFSEQSGMPFQEFMPSDDVIADALDRVFADANDADADAAAVYLLGDESIDERHSGARSPVSAASSAHASPAPARKHVTA